MSRIKKTTRTRARKTTSTAKLRVGNVSIKVSATPVKPAVINKRKKRCHCI